MNMFTNKSERSGALRLLLALLSGTALGIILDVLYEYSGTGHSLDFSFTLGIWSAPARIIARSLWGMMGDATGTGVGCRSVPRWAFLKGFTAGSVPFVMILALVVTFSGSPGAVLPKGDLDLPLLFLLQTFPAGLASKILAGGNRGTA
jgi:hypothetical protein